jgi:membrane-associated protein
LFFHKNNIVKAQNFYEKHGTKTIVLARFLPVVRTFAPIVAGIGKMDYPTFFKFNLLGGLVWTSGLSMLGFVLGNVIPDVDKYLLPITIAIVVISIIPSLLHLLPDRKK